MKGFERPDQPSGPTPDEGGKVLRFPGERARPSRERGGEAASGDAVKAAERLAAAGVEKVQRLALNAVKRTFEKTADLGALVPVGPEQTDARGNPEKVFFLQPGTANERAWVYEVDVKEPDSARWKAERWPVEDRSFEDTRDEGWTSIEDLRRKR